MMKKNEVHLSYKKNLYFKIAVRLKKLFLHLERNALLSFELRHKNSSISSPNPFELAQTEN